MMTSVPTLDADAARDAGVDELLSKPVMSSALRRALLHLLTGEPMVADVVELPDRSTEPSKGSVLVVEDNPVNQLVASGLLAALGYTSEVAADGLAGDRGGAASGGFDAVLMDVQMPRMDGYMATRHIRDTETGTAPADHRDDRRRRRGRARALPGRRHGRLPDQARGPGRAGRDARALAAARRRRTPTGSTWTGSAELRELDDPGDETSYVDRAIGNFLTSAPRDVAAAGRRLRPTGTPTELGAVAHRLAGAALNLGAVRVRRGGPGDRAAHAERRRLAEAAAALPQLGGADGRGPGGALRLPARAVPGPAAGASALRRPRPSSSSSSPSRRASATSSRTWVERPAAVVDLRVPLGGERLAQLGAQPVAHLLAGRVEDGQLLLGEVVVDHLGQLLDRVVERLGVGALELEHGQQRLVTLGVLLLAVLGLVRR